MRKIALAVCGLALLGYYGTSLAGPSHTGGATRPRISPERAEQQREASARDRTGGDSGQARHTRPRGAQPRRTTAAPDVPQTTRPRPHQVLDVVDGDTVTVAYRGGEVSVRVIGIDTPETVHPTEPVECGGPQASATASALLSGKRVRLVFDRSQGRLDAYGRTLAYVRAPGVGDFGLAMIRRGRAAEYTYDTSYAHQVRYQAAERKARASGRGIWAAVCGGVDTPLRSRPEHLTKPTPAVQRPGRPGHRSGGGRSGSCDPGYAPCVPRSVSDLDCADVDGPVRVLGDDPHGFDADGDGIGCDS